MSALLKIFISLIVIVCLFQFIEMASEEKKDDDSTKIINDISEQIKKAFSDENLKKLVDTASNALSEGAKAFEGQMKELKEKIDTMNEKKN